MAYAQELPRFMQDQLQQAQIPFESVSILVQPVNGAEPVIKHNTALPFHPASVMKLLTTYSALEILGPSYTWKTSAYTTGAQMGDILFGDLIIKGSGDPRFLLEDLWLFLRKIRASGIREIRGDLILDSKIFESGPFDAAAFDGDPFRPYNAGPSALLLNYKALEVSFIPDESGQTVQIQTNPILADYPVEEPRLAEGKCGDWKNKLAIKITDAGMKADGDYPLSCGKMVWYLSPYQMSDTRYFGAIFTQLWRDLGGDFAGRAKIGTVPQGARLLAESRSPALAATIRYINKYSNNVMARQLLLTIGAHESGMPGTPERGAQAIQMWLAKKGIKAEGLYIENGSGLSRKESFSADTLGAILKRAYASPIMPEFISSLPLVGQDGTTRRRLRDHEAAGKAHIKTGAINDVRAIAGYVLAASGQRYIVIMMVNHPKAAFSREAQDNLLIWVHDNN